MVRSMFAAVAGLRAHQTKMDVIGNNIANVNTYSYKKMRATFADQFYATLTGASEAGETYGGTDPMQIGYGSQIGSIDVNTDTGSIAATDRALDVMISGNGYFLVGQANKNGFATTSRTDGDNLTALNLTRVGIFKFDGSGSLVDVNGNHVYGFVNKNVFASEPVYGTKNADGDTELKLEALSKPLVIMDKNGNAKLEEVDIKDADGNTKKVQRQIAVYEKIADDGTKSYIKYDKDGNEQAVTIDTNGGEYVEPMKLNSISIGSDGTINGINDQNQVITMGKIAVANVPNPNALEALNNSYYRAKDNTGIITAETPGEGATGKLQAGKLEMSNVDLSQEMTDMITTQRGFQANSRIITVTDTMLEELINLKR